MRKVAAWLFSSLDGVVEAPNEWQFDFDDGMGDAINGLMEEQDALLLGRVTYGEWVGYWPAVPDDDPDNGSYAAWINNCPKYVFSSTLDSVNDWPHSTLVKTSLTDTVAELKQQKGGTISTAGSPTLVRSLIEHGLLDELTLLIHPVIAGGGRKRLFADDAALTKLALVSAEPTSSGVVIAKYRPAQ